VVFGCIVILADKSSREIWICRLAMSVFVVLTAWIPRNEKVKTNIVPCESQLPDYLLRAVEIGMLLLKSKITCGSPFANNLKMLDRAGNIYNKMSNPILVINVHGLMYRKMQFCSISIIFSVLLRRKA
jgi:hypothetical protein